MKAKRDKEGAAEHMMSGRFFLFLVWMGEM